MLNMKMHLDGLKMVIRKCNEMIHKDVIGILGGMGSYATVHIFMELLNTFPAEKEWDRPRIIIDNNCTMPSRVRAILYNENKEELIKEMANSMNQLVLSGCTKIVIGCNTAHAFLEDIYSIYPDLRDVVINMVEQCALYLINHKIKEVCIIASEGTHYAGVYRRYLYENNIHIIENETLEEERRFIEIVKTNNINKKIVLEFQKYLSEIDSEVIILGCTEFSVLYNLCEEIQINKQIVDPIKCVIDSMKRDLQ